MSVLRALTSIVRIGQAHRAHIEIPTKDYCQWVLDHSVAHEVPMDMNMWARFYG